MRSAPSGVLSHSKMFFEQGHAAIGDGHRPPFGLSAGAFAKNSERTFLPIDILRGEGLPLANAQAGIEQKPNQQFVLKYQTRFLEGLHLVEVEGDAFILVFHGCGHSISA